MNERSNKAVKAIIYNDDGRVLMQKRDQAPGLPFPGCWTFFGGLMENDESLVGALERELTEELGCVPGRLEPELFQWEWRSDWASTSNHFFPVLCKTETNHLELAEGQAMAWFSLEEIIRLPLTPAIYENFASLATFLSRFQTDLVRAVEDGLLAFNDLIRKNDRVFYARKYPFGLSRQQMFLLKGLACVRGVPVFRVCLHTDDQCDVHEMLMVHTAPTSVGPLKQNKSSLSYHVIDGALTVTLHGEDGKEAEGYRLGRGNPSESRCISLRLDAREYRTVQSTSPYAIFLEVASGPFQDSDTIWLNPTAKSAGQTDRDGGIKH